jgi:GT2 family glycosyltransferase
MMRITAVVVTYNRRVLLIRCIEHLRKQTVRLDNIIVVNNGSTDGTAEWLGSQTDLQVIHQENVGGSGGFYRGIQQAYDDGYDWIWCMDDDVYPEPDCLENLLKQDDEKVGILCPLRKRNGQIFVSEVRRFNLSNPFKSLHTYSLKTEDIKGKECVNIEGIAFEGPLIKREVVKKIGLPNKDLFLLYDDSDYGYRAVLAGFQIRLVTKAVMNKEQFFADDNRVIKVQKGKWKLYYHIRNTVYFNKKYGKNFMVRTLRPIAVFLKYEGYALKNLSFNKKYNVTDIKTFIQAYRDGIKGKLGKTKQP